MRVRVDHDVCEANGICEQLAPEVYRLRDDDVLEILMPKPPPELEDRVRLTVERCPKQALTLIANSD